MARKHYYVSPDGSTWKVTLDGVLQGHHYTQKSAIRAAVDAAHADGKVGHNAEVRVQGIDGQFRTEWTYGSDPYPPPG
jgi:hypothetical protein